MKFQWEAHSRPYYQVITERSAANVPSVQIYLHLFQIFPQTIGPMNAYAQHGPNKRPQLLPLSEFYYGHGLTVGC